MKVQNKIIISNIFMILIPLCFAVILLLAISNTVGMTFFQSTDQLYKAANGIISAQNYAYAYQEELWNENWQAFEEERAESNSNGEDPEFIQSRKTAKIEKKLKKLGYHISVMKDSVILYTTLTKSDIAVLKKKGEKLIAEAENLCIAGNGTSVIKTTFYQGDTECVLLAVNDSQVSMDERDSYFKKNIMQYVIIFFVAMLAVIILTNIVLSRWIADSILPPLKKLGNAAGNIRRGDLDTEITYGRQDEFGELCSDFEQMRVYLKESVQQRIADENSRKELISGISHDLRTPLTTIIGYAQGMVDGIASTPEKQKEYANAILLRADDMKNLVESLLLYNNLQNQEITYHFAVCDINEFINCYIKEHASDLEQGNVKTVCCLEQAEMPVFIDRMQMSRVLDNLIRNSIKYRVRDDTVLTVTTKRRKQQILLNVQDDGPGIPEDKRERIFDCFYRLDNSRTNSHEGNGLGLSIVKKIIEGHGGTVSTQNWDGLAMMIWLPCAEQQNTMTEGNEDNLEDIDCGR